MPGNDCITATMVSETTDEVTTFGEWKANDFLNAFMQKALICQVNGKCT